VGDADGALEGNPAAILRGGDPSGAVLPGRAYFWIVLIDCVMCCVPPPVSKLKLLSPTCGGCCSGATYRTRQSHLPAPAAVSTKIGSREQSSRARPSYSVGVELSSSVLAVRSSDVPSRT
jgi:hypothetical protein